jgi:hypothetical protein
LIAELNSADAKDAGPLSDFSVSAGKQRLLCDRSTLTAILKNQRIEYYLECFSISFEAQASASATPGPP